MAMMDLVTGGAASAVPGSSSSSNPVSALVGAIIGSSSKLPVIPREIIDVDEDDDPEVVFIGRSTSDYKNKQRSKFGQGFDMQLKVIPHEIIDVDEDDPEVVFIG